MSKYLRIAIMAGFAVGSVLLVLLMAASRNAVVFEKYYQPILWANTIVTLFLLTLVTILLVGFFKRALRKRYGFKILAKLSIALVLAGILPGFLIFIVSVELLYGSVDAWSDVTVEKALDSGLTLGREVLESYQKTTTEKAKTLAAEIAEAPPVQWLSKLHELSEREDYSEAMLVTSRGRLLGVSATSFSSLVPAVPSPRILQTVRREGVWEGLEEDESGSITAKAVVVLPTVELPNPVVGSTSAIQHEVESSGLFSLASPELGGATTDAVYLSFSEKIPPSLASNSEILMDGYRGYQEMVLARSGLRTIYIATLSLVLLLSVFVAAMVSLFLADQISKPLLFLLEGTRKVGSGRYELIPVASTKDEVGEVTEAFNVMTRKLAEAQQDIERRRELLQQANDYLERILTTMSSGVIVADANLNIISVNPSASRILHRDLTHQLGLPMAFVVPELLEILKEKLERMKKDENELVVQNEIMVPGKVQKRISLFIRGTELQFGGQIGTLFLFDDVTSIVAGQRAEAWTEVARRLAHEIKNPLTPIQLAAERLQMKLSGKVSGKEEEILHRATNTIVSQVTAMKQMVDDFRIYAKIGAPKFEKLDLSNFVEEVTNLYRAGGVKPNLDLEPGLPLIEADENQLRQVLHNLFSNSMEAATPGKAPEIYISTSVVVNPKTGAYTGVRLDFIDNGPGFSETILEHVFEPYMTTKTSGTGLGMAMIKKIIDEHGGEVTADNEIDADGNVIGARVTIIFKQLAQNRQRHRLK